MPRRTIKNQRLPKRAAKKTSAGKKKGKSRAPAEVMRDLRQRRVSDTTTIDGKPRQRRRSTTVGKESLAWSPREPLTPAETAQAKQRFLAEFATCGRVDIATREAGVYYRQPYFWQREDPEFAEAWELARNDAASVLEDAANRRAVRGTLKPVFQQGALIGYVREYSDSLLQFLLRGAKPERYKDRAEITGKDGAPIGTAGLSDASAEELRKKILGITGDDD